MIVDIIEELTCGFKKHGIEIESIHIPSKAFEDLLQWARQQCIYTDVRVGCPLSQYDLTFNGVKCINGGENLFWSFETRS